MALQWLHGGFVLAAVDLAVVELAFGDLAIVDLTIGSRNCLNLFSDFLFSTD